jgi:hypothetical protein
MTVITELLHQGTRDLARKRRIPVAAETRSDK